MANFDDNKSQKLGTRSKEDLVDEEALCNEKPSIEDKERYFQPTMSEIVDYLLEKPVGTFIHFYMFNQGDAPTYTVSRAYMTLDENFKLEDLELSVVDIDFELTLKEKYNEVKDECIIKIERERNKDDKEEKMFSFIRYNPKTKILILKPLREEIIRQMARLAMTEYYALDLVTWLKILSNRENFTFTPQIIHDIIGINIKLFGCDKNNIISIMKDEEKIRKLLETTGRIQDIEDYDQLRLISIDYFLNSTIDIHIRNFPSISLRWIVYMLSRINTEEGRKEIISIVEKK